MTLLGGRWDFNGCALRAGGDGSVALAVGGTAEAQVRGGVLGGVDAAAGYRRPYVCAQCGGSAALVIEDAVVEAATGCGPCSALLDPLWPCVHFRSRPASVQSYSVSLEPFFSESVLARK